MTKEQKRKKRIEVAHDVLDRIGTGQYLIKGQGRYYSNMTVVPSGNVSVLVEAAIAEPCEVCALGALFCSYALKRPRISWKAAVKKGDREKRATGLQVATDEIQGLMSELFESWELALIEHLFEGWRITPGGAIFKALGDKAGAVDRASCLILSLPKEHRLRMIAYNIIENGGDFKPELL